MTLDDEDQLKALQQQAKAADYRLRDIILAVACSPLLQQR